MTDQQLINQLDAELVELHREVDRLRSQLPEGMERCTIVFQECEKGHGRLTATNWIQHGCQTCEIERLRAENDAQQQIAAANTEEIRQLHNEIANLRAENEALKKDVLDTTWQDHADAWQKRALKAEAEHDDLRARADLLLRTKP